MKKAFTASFLFLLVAEVVYNISSYLINAGVGRLLGPAEYGRYSVVAGFATMFTILVARGVPTAMAKRISEHTGDWSKIRAIVHTATTLQWIVVSTVTLVYFLCAPLFARAFSDPSLTILFYLSALILPFFALSSFKVLYFNGLKAYTFLSVIKLTRGIMRVVMIVGLAFFFSTQGAIVGAAIAPLLVYIIATVLDRVYIAKPVVTELAQKYPWKDLASYAWTFMLFLLFYEFYMRIDMYLIKAMLGDDLQTGLYRAAMTIAMIPYFAIFAVTFILFPTMSGLAKKKDFVGIRKLLNNVLLLLGVTLPAAALFFFFFGEFVTVLLYGESFRAAASLIPYMLGGTVFGTVFYVFASVFNGAGYTKLTAGIVAAAVALSISANMYFLPRYGIEAAAMVFSYTSILMGLTALFAAYIIFYRRAITNSK